MEEKRKQPRRQADEFLDVCDNQTGAAIGQVVNLTEHGAMLRSEKPIRPNTTFQCRMTLPARMQSNDTFTFEAESRWCITDRETGTYLTGYQFRNMTQHKRGIVRKLLESWSFSLSTTVET